MPDTSLPLGNLSFQLPSARLHISLWAGIDSAVVRMYTKNRDFMTARDSMCFLSEKQREPGSFFCISDRDEGEAVIGAAELEEGWLI